MDATKLHAWSCAFFGMLAPAVAAAQSVAAPCHVEIASAPPAVADEIQRWVRAEPRCMRELVVRVEQTAAGLHLVAIDPEGRIRERIVPDAETAAVLVVSWMADDSSEEPPPPAPPDVVANEAPPPAPGELVDEPSAAANLQSTAPRRSHWLVLGASMTDDGRGVHGQSDIFVRGPWSFGAGAGWRRNAQDADDRRTPSMSLGSTSFEDANAFGAYTWHVRRVDVRAQLGLGMAVDTHGETMPTRPSTTTVVPELGASALAGVRVTDRWGVIGGPLLEVTTDRHVPFDLSAFLGVECGLR